MPRLLSLFLLTLAAFVALYFLAPEQLPVVLYKAAVVAFAVVLGYWVDRAVFPYARPDSFLVMDWRLIKVPEHGEHGLEDYPVIEKYRLLYGIAMIRRALIIVAVVVGVGLGL